MRVLVTGGAGFIGSHLCERFLERGDEVRVLDDLSTGTEENVAHLRNRKGFQLTHGSVLDDGAVGRLVDRCDAIFHLAAAVGVFKIVEEPVRTIELNIQGTDRVLAHAARRSTPVLLASTSEVYGKSSKIPYSEEDDIVLGSSSRSRWCYAASKLVDEHLALAHWRERGLPTVVARLFNTVGPRQTGQYGMVIPRFVTQALEGGPITVYGDGGQSRCFAHVQDVTDALIRLIECHEARGKIFNVGNDSEISILDLAEKVRQKANPDAQIRRIPYEEAYAPGFEDLRRRVPDLQRIRATIAYAPSRTLDDILDDVIADVKQRPLSRSQ